MPNVNDLLKDINRMENLRKSESERYVLIKAEKESKGLSVILEGSSVGLQAALTSIVTALLKSGFKEEEVLETFKIGILENRKGRGV